ncbi:MAG: hypothetical protein ACR2MB_11730 [Acidimicrobiales bacterium]
MVKLATGVGLAGREAEHDDARGSEPGDAERRRIGSDAQGERGDGLDGDVDGEQEEREADEAHGTGLVVAGFGALELPDDDDRRRDLDERVEREPSQRHRPSRNRSRNQETDLDDVPPERGVLQAELAPAKQRPALAGKSWCFGLHCFIRSR